tara:strand:- start:52210 stop:52641 length:432 start_codon:yes stop_codon:yes gene_type:complete
VGIQTSLDTIAYSKKPAAITQCLPRGLRDVPRNKPDEVFKACAEKGGVTGTALFAPGFARGNDATVADVMEYTMDLIDEDHVAIGTDFNHNRPRPGPWLLCAKKDKGTCRTLTAEMVKRGWSRSRIKKILGGNWMRLFGTVWG